MLISSFLFWAFEEQFDQKQWQSQPSMRYKMADDIIDNERLLGKTKAEVILMLGEPSDSHLKGQDHLIYSLGKPPSFFESQNEELIVIFKYGLVTKVIRSSE